MFSSDCFLSVSLFLSLSFVSASNSLATLPVGVCKSGNSQWAVSCGSTGKLHTEWKAGKKNGKGDIDLAGHKFSSNENSWVLASLNLDEIVLARKLLVQLWMD